MKDLATSFVAKVQLLFISLFQNTWKAQVMLRFIGSFRFMPRSLEKLASYLNNDKKKLRQNIVEMSMNLIY